jgi:hypothetical protein
MKRGKVREGTRQAVNGIMDVPLFVRSRPRSLWQKAKQK